MPVVADTHVHLYGCHDTAESYSLLVANLGRLAPGADQAALLAERHDCDAFGALNLAGGIRDTDVLARPSDEAGCLLISRQGSAPLYLFAGRQVATAERLELLGLTLRDTLPDGEPAHDTVRRILDVGGIPVLSWAPGKWLFGRGRAVRQLLDDFGPRELLIGDSTLRPMLCPEPRPMRQAGNSGRRILAGSDPLPFEGDNRYLGTYGMVIPGRLAPEAPVTVIRDLIRAGDADVRRIGRRAGPPATAGRLIRHALS